MDGKKILRVDQGVGSRKRRRRRKVRRIRRIRRRKRRRENILLKVRVVRVLSATNTKESLPGRNPNSPNNKLATMTKLQRYRDQSNPHSQ